MVKQVKCLFLFILLFTFQSLTYSQVKEPGYTYIPWKDIKLENTSQDKRDTTIVIITTRKYSPDHTEFFGTEQDQPGQLHYALATLKNKSWRVEIKNSFEEAISQMPIDKDFLFYVHGDGKTFPDVLEGGLRMSILYGINFIAFDYPTKDNELPFWRNFHTSRLNVNNAQASFGKFLNEIDTYKTSRNQNTNYTLLMHSLGNVLIKNCSNLNYATELFENVVMNAPAVGQKKHSQWVEKIVFQKNLYIVSNRRDIILTGAYFITFRNQLGKTIRRPYAQNANYVLLDKVAGPKHSFFLDIELLNATPAVKHFFDTVLHGYAANPESCCYLKVKRQPNIYTVGRRPDCKFIYPEEKIFVTTPASTSN